MPRYGELGCTVLFGMPLSTRFPNVGDEVVRAAIRRECTRECRGFIVVGVAAGWWCGDRFAANGESRLRLHAFRIRKRHSLSPLTGTPQRRSTRGENVCLRSNDRASTSRP